jgi:FkbM family methyltransferase
MYFGLLKKDPVFWFKNGQKLKIRVKSTDFYALTNVWLVEEYNQKKLDIRKGDTIIDIGAHIGSFTIYASQFCNKGRIYCYEPIKDNYELLVHNISINKLTNAIPIQKAVSDKTGSVKIFLSPDSAAHSLFMKTDQYADVESISLKEIFDSNKIEHCDLLKLDCEGSEYLILNSLPDSYFELIQKIVMEYHINRDEPNQLQNLMDKLKSLNYNVNIEKDIAESGILFAIKEYE